MKLKRYWYLAHRWLGIVLCLFFAMWFFSGVVMMYVGFPNLDRQERLDALPVIDASDIAWGPEPLLAQVELSNIAELRLTSIASRPAYVLKTQSGEYKVRFADNGEVLTADAALAIKSAQQFLLKSENYRAGHEVVYQRLIDIDQWSVSSSLNTHRPLHRVALGDSDNTELYISSRTGEVVRDVNQTERVWNWLGANLHWIYPVQLRKHASLWADVVIALSLVACLLVLSGAVIGIQRLRVRKPYRGKDYSPYRGIDKWHHLLGLVALVFLSTYTVSGLMSMNPWGIFDDSDPIAPQLQRYQFGTHARSSASVIYSEPQAIKTLLADHSVLEVSWRWLGSESYVVLQTQDKLPKALVYAAQPLSTAAIHSAIETLLPEEPIDSMHVLNQYGLYYYSHHDRYRPLPVIKVEFGDEHGTWFYIDERTGEVLDRLTRTGRVQRWLYNGLHSLDFALLIQHRPVWDVLVITLCVMGFVFSLTAVYLGGRRIRR